MMNASKQDAVEQTALAEYAAHKGKLLRVNTLSGYYNESDMDTFDCDVIVRVRETPEDDVLRWNGDWLDPYWDVEVVRYLTPPAKPLRSVWIDGPSHNLHSGERTWDAELISRWQYLRLVLKSKGETE